MQDISQMEWNVYFLNWVIHFSAKIIHFMES